MQTLINLNTPPILFQFPPQKNPQIQIRVSNRVNCLSSSSVSGDNPVLHVVSGENPAVRIISGDNPLGNVVSGENRAENDVSGENPVGSDDSGENPVGSGDSGDVAGVRRSYEGVKLKGKVWVKKKRRLDAWIKSRIPRMSLVRAQYSIRAGLVSVNGRVVDKVAYVVKTGDKVTGTIAKLQQLRPEVERTPLDIKYEDEHVLVVNKPPYMVVHPTPGNSWGTLIDVLANHYSLPNVPLNDSERVTEEQDLSDEDVKMYVVPKDQSHEQNCFHPRIVHRLDKGTSGLLVVAKDKHSRDRLAEQFLSNTVTRVCVSLTAGVPGHISDRVEVPIGRDVKNPKRMTADYRRYKPGTVRHAASRYQVLEVLASGGAALVEWRLDTGRTHQIRAHTKYLGIPLLGDDLYGGTKDVVLKRLQPKIPAIRHGHLIDLLTSIERPCLHAMALGFKHPCTGEYMHFSCPPPADFAEVLSQLRSISS